MSNSSQGEDSAPQLKRPRKSGQRLNRRVAATIAAVSVAILVIGGFALVRAAQVPDGPGAGNEPMLRPAKLPLVVPLVGGIVGWDVMPSAEVAGVWPVAGEASEGNSSLLVRAPVLAEASTVAVTAISAPSDGLLSFALRIRVLDGMQAPGLAVEVAGERVDLVVSPDEEWQVAKGEIKNVPRGADSLRLVVTAPHDGFLIDEVSLTQRNDDENLVVNGSFEEIELGQGVVNQSLVLTSSTAGIAYNAPSSLASWSVVDTTGVAIASGEIDEGQPSIVDLREIPPGHYRADIVDRSGAAMSAEFALVDTDSVVVEPDSRLGVTTHVERDYYSESAGLAASVGAGIVRNDVLWNLNEATLGNYAFDSRYTSIFDQVKANGIGLLAIAGYGNPNYESWKTPSNADSVAAYGRYAGAVAREFEPVGLEVWNEFNHEPFNSSTCGLGAECYLPLLSAASSEVRAASPNTTVIAGVTALYDSPWFQTLWGLGGADYAEAMSFHPYEVYSDPESLSGVIDQARVDFRASSAAEDKPIWITELGWTTKTGDVSRDEQASRLVRSAVVALAAGVERYVWYDLINDDPDPSSHEGNFGLFSQPSVGSATLSPKPAAYSFALLSSRIGNLEVSNASMTADGVQTVDFGSGENIVRVVWATSTVSNVPIKIAGEQAVLESVLGGSIVQPATHGVIRLEVTPTPVIITEVHKR